MESSPPPEKWDLKEWCTDLVMRFAFMDKIITWGLEHTPTFWLGAFFNPILCIKNNLKFFFLLYTYLLQTHLPYRLHNYIFI